MKKDKKTKKGKKKWIIIILLISIAGISYFKSYEIYRFYSKLYMVYWFKYSVEDIIRIINDKAEIGNIRDLQIFVNRALNTYPNNYNIMKHAGNAFIKLGSVERGIAMLLIAYDHIDITSSELYNLVKLLFESENYKDIISVMRTHERLKDSRIAGMLGISLYFSERYEEAIPELKLALRSRHQGSDLDKLFFLAMSYIKTGRDSQALPYLERAYRLDETNRRIISELVALYGRLGQTRKASQLMENLSWRLRWN